MLLDDANKTITKLREEIKGGGGGVSQIALNQ